MLRAFLFVVILALAPGAFGEKWVQQYFYDENGKELHLTDLAFASVTRGIAVGAIVNVEGRDDGRAREFLALVTSDAGEHWAKVALKEFPRSVFFLNQQQNDTLGWMVTENGIWFTEEAGRSWRKVSEQIGAAKKLFGAPAGGVIDRVWFLNAKHGFAIGARKSVFETKDGGRTWVAVVAKGGAETPKSVIQQSPEQIAEDAVRLAYTAYTAIGFWGDWGIITGALVPPQRATYGGVPGWMEPQTMIKRSPSRTQAFELDTGDAGMNWRLSTAPVYGAMTQIRLTADWGLSVWNFDDAAPWASEAQRIHPKTGQGETVFRRADRRVTDSQLFADGSAFLAAVEPMGTMRSAPIPGKVRILRAANVAALPAAVSGSASREGWEEMAVDYRAVANLVYLAGPDAEHMWAATDTGMILKLVK